MTRTQANKYAMRMYREGRMPAMSRWPSTTRQGKYEYRVQVLGPTYD